MLVISIWLQECRFPPTLRRRDPGAQPRGLTTRCAAVDGPAPLGVLGADRAFLPVADRADAAGRDALRDEVVSRRLRAPIAEREIVFDGAALVALPLDENQHVMGLEPGGVGLDVLASPGRIS